MGVEIEDNAARFVSAMNAAAARALEGVGARAEGYARALAERPARLAPELKRSIAHRVEDGTLTVGSSLDVAAYVELGTGPLYETPPEWMENRAPGGRGRAGEKQWYFMDPVERRVRLGTPQPARPFLRPAIEGHLDEYAVMIGEELRRAGESSSR